MWAWAGAAPAVMAAGVSAIVFVRHADNIRRLRDGSEPLIGQGR